MADHSNQDAVPSESPMQADGGVGDSCQQLYFYLFSHISNMSQDILEGIHKKKSNLLTIMSFCLVGMLTATAAALQSESVNLTAAIIFFASYILWLVAFLQSLRSKVDEGYRVIPGCDEGFRFLPPYVVKKLFMESECPAGYADVFFMKYYEEYGKKQSANMNEIEEWVRRINWKEEQGGAAYQKLVKEYSKSVYKDDAVKSFNYNAWFSSLIFMHQAQRKHLAFWRKRFHQMQKLFAACMIVFLGGLFFLIMKWDPIPFFIDAAMPSLMQSIIWMVYVLIKNLAASSSCWC